MTYLCKEFLSCYWQSGSSINVKRHKVGWQCCSDSLSLTDFSVYLFYWSLREKCWHFQVLLQNWQSIPFKYISLTCSSIWNSATRFTLNLNLNVLLVIQLLEYNVTTQGIFLESPFSNNYHSFIGLLWVSAVMVNLFFASRFNPLILYLKYVSYRQIRVWLDFYQLTNSVF